MPRGSPRVGLVGRTPGRVAARGRWAAMAVVAIMVANALGVSAIVGVGGVGRLALGTAARPDASTRPVPSYLEPAYPPALLQNAMVYDGADGYTVMFGGYIGAIGSVASDVTWVFLNNTWYRLTSAVEPAPSAEVGMAYDPVIREVVLYETAVGGAQTWSYTAGNWTNLSGTSGVAGGPGFEPLAISFDDALDQVVLSGMLPTSHGEGTQAQVIWGLSPGGGWENLTVVPSQLAVMLGWDPLNDSLMFAHCNDTLSLQSGAWTTNVTSPWGSPCLGNGGFPFANMITWDPSVPGFLVLSLAFAYEYGRSWTMLPQVLPLPGSYGALAYDANSAAAVEFGGFLVNHAAGPLRASDTTWLFAHGNWTALPMPPSPSSFPPWVVLVVFSVAAAAALLLVVALRRRRHRLPPGGGPSLPQPPPP